MKRTYAPTPAFVPRRIPPPSKHPQSLRRAFSFLGLALAAILLALFWMVVEGGMRQAEHSHGLAASATRDRLACELLSSAQVRKACVLVVAEAGH